MADERLIGSWRLLSYRAESNDGRVLQPLGADPDGRLIYSADGSMSAVMVASGGPSIFWQRVDGGTVEEKAAAFDSVVAYAATYEVQGNRLIHRVTVASIPRMAGSIVEREFRLDGDNLELSFVSRSGERVWTNRLLWQRA